MCSPAAVWCGGHCSFGLSRLPSLRYRTSICNRLWAGGVVVENSYDGGNVTTNPQARLGKRRTARIVAVSAIAGVVGIVGATAAGAAQAAPEQAAPQQAGTTSAGEHRIERLRLDCVVRHTEERAGVGCHWSAPTADRADGVRLLRIAVGSEQVREVVYRSSNLEVTEYADTPVRRSHRYVYMIQAISETGHVVGMSRPVTVAVPAAEDPAGIEPLRLNCAQGGSDAATDRIHIACGWSLPGAETARTLTLFRSVDGAAREAIASSHRPFQSVYRDTLPAGTSTVVYAVVATDGAGEIVAQSRPSLVQIRRTDRQPVDVRPVDERPTDVATTTVSGDVPETEVVRPTVVDPTLDVNHLDPSRTRARDTREAVVEATRVDVPQRDVPQRDLSLPDVVRQGGAD